MSAPIISHSLCPNCWHPIHDAGSRFCPTCGVNVQAWSGVAVHPAGAVGDSSSSNVVALDHSPITIGRDPANDVHLDHPAVSRRHAQLEWRPADDNWYVVDVGSAKGTFINYHQIPNGPEGWPVEPAVDTVWIAPYAFRFATGRPQENHFEPAHLRLDAVGLLRSVKHEATGKMVSILNLQATPLSFRPGEFIALVGGSGAGKSTLMKALLGLAPAQEGAVYVGGRPLIEDGQAYRFDALHAIVGYVPQDDIVHSELTPLEAMEYVARLRLSPDLSREERLARIQETLTIVELWPHRHKRIGNLSGGQRKRVNIALELLAQPRLLFLDEPTSGLDPGLDLAIMELLRGWATDPADPRTIILVTHATENVTNCKYVAFMAPGGYVVYFGPPAAALDYFDVPRFAEIYRKVNGYHFPELSPVAGPQENGEPAPDVRDLAARFCASKDYFQYVTARQLDETQVADLGTAAVDSGGRRPLKLDREARTRWGRQLGLLTGRYWKLIARDRVNFAILLLQGVLVAGLLWAVARPDTFLPRGAENAQTVLFIMACAVAWLGILNATKEIVKEQDIYARERRYGLDAVPYVLSKLIVLATIGAFQVATLLWLVSYRLTFPANGALASWSPVWLEWFVTLTLALTAGLALGLFLSASARTIDAATAVMFVLLLIQVMFAGLFFPDAAWADFLSAFTFSRWALEAAGTTANLNGLLQSAVGAAYRPDPAYSYSAYHLLSRWAILGGYIVLFTLLAAWRQSRK
jgi:ABC transport system ATP-binding/permease protein